MTSSSRQRSAAEVKLVSGPNLWRLKFAREQVAQETPPGGEAELKFNLSLTRLAEHRLGVELEVDVQGIPEWRAEVAFRAVFELVSSPREGSETEDLLRHFAARNAPSILYPFAREAIVSAAQKAGRPGFVPPVVNFESVFNLEALQVPPFAPAAK